MPTIPVSEAGRLWITIVQTGLSIAALVFFVRWDVQAVAAGYVVSMYLLLPPWYLAFRGLVQIRLADYLRQFAPALLGAAAMVVVVLGVGFLTAGSPVLVRLAVAALAGVAVYVATVHLTDRSALRLILGLIGIRSGDASAAGRFWRPRGASRLSSARSLRLYWVGPADRIARCDGRRGSWRWTHRGGRQRVVIWEIPGKIEAGRRCGSTGRACLADEAGAAVRLADA